MPFQFLFTLGYVRLSWKQSISAEICIVRVGWCRMDKLVIDCWDGMDVLLWRIRLLAMGVGIFHAPSKESSSLRRDISVILCDWNSSVRSTWDATKEVFTFFLLFIFVSRWEYYCRSGQERWMRCKVTFSVWGNIAGVTCFDNAFRHWVVPSNFGLEFIAKFRVWATALISIASAGNTIDPTPLCSV